MRRRGRRGAGRLARRPYTCQGSSGFRMAAGFFPVQCPLEGIAGNVPPDAVQFLLVADDVFVEITLPYRFTRAAAQQVDTLGGQRLERADHPTQRLAPHGDGSRTALISIADDNDAVQMVGHNDPFVEIQVRVALGEPSPTVGNRTATIGVVHPILYNRPKNRFAITYTDCHEISAIL